MKKKLMLTVVTIVVVALIINSYALLVTADPDPFRLYNVNEFTLWYPEGAKEHIVAQGENFGYVYGGNYLYLKDVDFQNNDCIVNLEFQYSGDPKVCFEGIMQVRLGSPTGQLLAEIPLGPTSGWGNYVKTGAQLGNLKGKNDIYFVLDDKDDHGKFLSNLKGFTLIKGEKVVIDPFKAYAPTEFKLWYPQDAKEHIIVSGDGFGYVYGGNYLYLEDIDFGENEHIVNLEFQYSGDPKVCFEGTMQVRLGSATGQIIAEIPLGPTAGWGNYVKTSAKLGNLKGNNDIYFVLDDKDDHGKFMPNLKGFTLIKGDKVITDPFKSFSASEFKTWYPQDAKEHIIVSGDGFGYVYGGNYFYLENVDFGANEHIVKFEFQYSGDPKVCFEGELEIRSGSSTGQLIAEVPLGPTTSWGDYKILSAELGNLKGMNDLYFVLDDKDDHGKFLPNLKGFTFVKGEKIITDPFKSFSAADFKTWYPQDAKEHITVSGDSFGYVYGGNYFYLENVDFGANEHIVKFEFQYAGDPKVCFEGKMQIRSGSATGNILAEVPLGPTTSWGDYKILSAELGNLKGMNDLYFVLDDKDDHGKFLPNLKGFTFIKGELAEEPSEEPSEEPTEEPTEESTEEPTQAPTEEPTDDDEPIPGTSDISVVIPFALALASYFGAVKMSKKR